MLCITYVTVKTVNYYRFALSILKKNFPLLFNPSDKNGRKAQTCCSVWPL